MFGIDDFVTLGLLTLLQAVLGFDNLLYISLTSRRAPAEQQVMVRRMGIGLAKALYEDLRNLGILVPQHPCLHGVRYTIENRRKTVH